jgi:hypothetical protein
MKLEIEMTLGIGFSGATHEEVITLATIEV